MKERENDLGTIPGEAKTSKHAYKYTCTRRFQKVRGKLASDPDRCSLFVIENRQMIKYAKCSHRGFFLGGEG